MNQTVMQNTIVYKKYTCLKNQAAKFVGLSKKKNKIVFSSFFDL